MSSLLQDVRYAVRTLARSPGFAAVAVLTLALGIGANTAIFSFVDGMLLKPLPYADADRIVRVLEKPPRGERNGISTLNFLDWQTGQRRVRVHGRPDRRRRHAHGRERTDSAARRACLGALFRHLRHQGGARPDVPARRRPAREGHVAVLSHVLWVNQFGADPAIVNRTILLDNEPHTVVGVLPAGSAFDRAFNQIWRPLAFEPSNMTRNFHWLASFARLKPGVSLQQAQANMNAIGAAHRDETFPIRTRAGASSSSATPIRSSAPDMRTALLVLMTATGLVLLIGCANLANLALARGISREREVAIRASLGAGRWRLVRQFLTENVLLSMSGGVLGIALATASMKWLQLLVPPFSFAREADDRDGRAACCCLRWPSRSSPACCSAWPRRCRRPRRI